LSNSTKRFLFSSLPRLQYPTRHKHSCLIIHCACMTAYPPNLGPDRTRHHSSTSPSAVLFFSPGLSSPILRLPLPLRILVKVRDPTVSPSLLLS
jgi:hypothetical protein